MLTYHELPVVYAIHALVLPPRPLSSSGLQCGTVFFGRLFCRGCWILLIQRRNSCQVNTDLSETSLGLIIKKKPNTKQLWKTRIIFQDYFDVFFFNSRRGNWRLWSSTMLPTKPFQDASQRMLTADSLAQTQQTHSQSWPASFIKSKCLLSHEYPIKVNINLVINQNNAETNHPRPIHP